MMSFILLAGGKGTRMDQELPKQFLMLAGKPVIMHILERLESLEEISEVVVVCLEDYKMYIEDYIDKYDLKKSYNIIIGGNTRQESAFKGIEAAKYDNVIIHEAARPFVTIDDFKDLIEEKEENVVYGTEIPFTVLKKENSNISGILDRKDLVNIQLPQKFIRKQLLDAHYKAKEEKTYFTEDASLLHYYKNTPILIVEGKDYNIKLTTNLDLIIAEEIYKEYMVVR